MLEITDIYEEEIQRQTGISLEHLLAPVSPDQPSGVSLRYDSEYEMIKEARREDDPNLPQGVWVHDLKKADWPGVISLCTTALVEKSKDVQLGVWLLEALIHQSGFTGITTGCLILQQLCERYWDSMYPQIIDGDLEYRTNPIQWANENLPPALNLIPLTQTPKEHRELNWADWEMALQIERVTSNTKSGNGDGKGNGNGRKPAAGFITVSEFKQFIEATPTPFYKQMYLELSGAFEAVASLNTFLNEKCGNEAPSLGKITNLLVAIKSSCENILHDRGVPLTLAAQAGGAGGTGKPSAGTGKGKKSGGASGTTGSSGGGRGPGGDEGTGGGTGGGGPIRNRQQAYARLQEASEYLRQIEPHSPVPYLVSMAIDWGKMSTAELYRDLFLRGQGQLSIFEILGIKPEDTQGQ